jgi:hypothetical protein
MISKADDSEKHLSLEEIAATLLEAARKLSPGQDRHEALKKIGSLRARIAALKAKGK